MKLSVARLSSLILALGVFLAGCVSSPSARLLKEHPSLRRADGTESDIRWTKQDGDDFIVFYGELPNDPSAGAGIYQGGDPRFRPPIKITPIKGKLGVFEVDWYALPDKDSKFYRTCLIEYQRANVRRGQKLVTYTTKRHVWAYADTEEGLNRVIGELDKLAMFAVRPADIGP